MAYREFVDEAGTTWRVWDTYPQNPATVFPALEQGWLCFEHGERRYRLAPIPEGWTDCATARLCQLLRQAQDEGPKRPRAESDP
jgi:hypothetical protein